MGKKARKPKAATAVPEWKAARPHTYTFTPEAHSLVCNLRLNPNEAKKYCPDLKITDGTNADDMMLAMFRKLQGVLTPVRSSPVANGTRTEKGASLYKLERRVGRPSKEAAAAEAAARLVGQRWRQYKQQQARKQQAPAARAAAKAGRLPVGSFTARGTAVTSAKEAAIVQVEQFKAWLPGFHCRCGERFRYVERGSRQVGAAAVWEVQCAGGCAPLHLATSPSLFSDDYEINYTLQHGCELCAVPFGRASDLLRYAGLGQLSERDNNATKAELEQPLAHAAHTAMARAWEEEQLAGVTKSEGCLCLDDGWNHGRNGSECTQPVMSATTGRLVHYEHSRRSDPDIKSSQALEKKNCRKTVSHPLIKLMEYDQVSVDGATATIAALRKAGFHCQGDPWHATRNRGKHFSAHVDAFAPRETPGEVEQAARKMDKVTRPAQALAEKAPALAKLALESPPPSVESMRARLDGHARAVDPLESDAQVREAYAALRTVEHVGAALAALAATKAPATAVPARAEGLPLHAYGQQLTSVFKIHARQSVMTPAECTVWASYDRYTWAQMLADAARAVRTARNKQLKAMRTVAHAWELTFRAVYNFVFAYTASLRGATNPDTQQPWTDAERTALAQELYPEAALSLAAGFVDSEALRTIAHPASKKKAEEYSWTPPAEGFVEVGENVLWECLEGWVRDPHCLDKFSFYIDNRSTAICECFMSKKLKWNPKASHRTRYYMNGIWCAVLDHNENVMREVRGKRWQRGGSLKHPGRWYQTTVRVATTDVWRRDMRRAMTEQARMWSSGTPPPQQVQPTFIVRANASAIQAEVKATMESMLAAVEAACASEVPAVVEHLDAAEASTVGGEEAASAIDPEVTSVVRELVAKVVAQQAAAHPRIARVAAEAYASSRAREAASTARGPLLQPASVTAETAKAMKVPELKEALSDRGLEQGGKKAELLSRLLEAVEAEQSRARGEVDGVATAEGDEDDEDDEGELTGGQQPTGASDPMAVAEAAGIALQWYMLCCPTCESLLQARLPYPLTRLACSACGVSFVAPNAHVERLPPKPLWKPKPVRKRSMLQLAQDAFVKQAVPRLMEAEAGLTQQQALARAMTTEWPQHKAALNLASAAAAPAASAPRGEKRSIAIAEPLDEASGAIVSERAYVLGLHATSLTPLPPPAFVPLAQMPKKKRVAATASKLKPLSKTPTTRGQRRPRRGGAQRGGAGRKRWKPPQAVPIQLSTAAGASSSSAVAVPDAAAAAAALCDLSAVAPAQSSTARGKRKAVPESGVGGSPVERVVCALKDLGDEISMHTLQQHTQLDRGTLRGALKVMESQNQCMVRGDIVHMI